MLYDFSNRVDQQQAQEVLAKQLASRAVKDNQFLIDCGIEPVKYHGVPFAGGIWVGIRVEAKIEVYVES